MTSAHFEYHVTEPRAFKVILDKTVYFGTFNLLTDPLYYVKIVFKFFTSLVSNKYHVEPVSSTSHIDTRQTSPRHEKTGLRVSDQVGQKEWSLEILS